MPNSDDLMQGHLPVRDVTAAEVAEARSGARQLVVLDDDPTGTQSVADLPVLNSWTVDDLAWALRTGARAVYVMTNSRSLAPDDARERNREVVTASLAAAERLGIEVDFVSRGDSTLRGHFPLEPNTIAEVMADHGIAVDSVLIVPAFGDAGRITVDAIHYAGSEADGFLPVGESEFAKDATFGYRSSDLRDWAEEKSAGRIDRDAVAHVGLDALRGDPGAAVEVLTSGASHIAVDIVAEEDLRCLALALRGAESAGRRFIFRVGPPFVRALIGQDVHPPLGGEELASRLPADAAPGGLIVVGSHVALTTRQLEHLVADQAPLEIELDVATILTDDASSYLGSVVGRVVEGLAHGNVVLRTSRTLVRGDDGDSSLSIARQVSDAVVTAVRETLRRTRPRFVIAKGGITSSDVAARGLEIGRAMVLGPMLPGIVSLWQPIDGPAVGIPYIVFAGNVGGDTSLAEVARKLSSPTLDEE